MSDLLTLSETDYQWLHDLQRAEHAAFSLVVDYLRKAVVEIDAQRERARKEDHAHGVTIDQRDRAEEWADKLAYAIADEETIGEHSNLNNPWAQALEVLESNRLVDPEMVGELEALRLRQDEWKRERERCERYHAGLRHIAEHPHCTYYHDGAPQGDYGIGVVDGHRCAANIAKQYLATDGTPISAARGDGGAHPK